MPRALHEFGGEVKDLDTQDRQMGHRAECDLCGEMVDLDRSDSERQGRSVPQTLLG